VNETFRLVGDSNGLGLDADRKADKKDEG
jgi:hypothetical protein